MWKDVEESFCSIEFVFNTDHNEPLSPICQVWLSGVGTNDLWVVEISTDIVMYHILQLFASISI